MRLLRAYTGILQQRVLAKSPLLTEILAKAPSIRRISDERRRVLYFHENRIRDHMKMNLNYEMVAEEVGSVKSGRVRD